MKNDLAISPLQFSETRFGSPEELRVAEIAEFMVAMAIGHSNESREDFRITNEGWEVMSTIFGKVPEELRANVFAAFLTTLIVDGYKFDKLQFQNGPAQ